MLPIPSTRVSSYGCKWRNYNFSGKWHNIKLTMGEYVLNIPILSIPMGGADVVLRVQWLQYLGTIAFNFQELFLKIFS